MAQPQLNFHKLFSLSIFAIILFFNSAAIAQQSTKGIIKGHVVIQNDGPAENVSVTLKGTKYGTVTNEDGDFTLRVPQGKYTLIISQVGSKSQETSVDLANGQTLTLPQFTVSKASNNLQEVSISGSKVNKFKTKKSVDVAKMPLNNLENAQVYTTITNQLIQEQQIFSVDDAIRNAPGIQKMWEATGRGGDGGSYYNSRGFIVQSKLRNGIAGNVTSTIDAVNLERIEVIKGPSATLFGSTLTSYGGLINRVTKTPYDSFGGEVSFADGNYDFHRVALDINTPLDVQKKVLFRLNTAFNNDGSFQNNGFNRYWAIAPSLLYKVNDRLTISADAELSYGKNIGKSIFFMPYNQTVAALGYTSADQLKLDYKQSYHGDGLTQTSNSTSFFGQVKYKISDQWTTNTNISATHSFSNGFNPYFYLLPKDSISREDQSTKNSTDDMIEIQQNFNGDFKIGKFRNRFVGGLDFFRENSNQHFFSTAFDRASVLGSHDYSNFNQMNMDAVYAKGTAFVYPSVYKTNTYSAYVSDVFNITDQLIASAAIRVDRFDNKGNYNPATNTTSGGFKQTAFSPKFGLIYQPVKDHVALFANYQNGFTNKNGLSENNKPLKPEQANQIEGGVKIDLFDGKLSSTLSYYDIKVKDIVRQSTINQALSVQDGTQLSKGFEAEVIANPVTGLNIIAGFSYNDSKLEKTADLTVEGLRPTTAGSPYTANFWASYRISKGLVKGLGFGFGGNYASDNKIINSKTLGVFSLPAYTVLNASVFYDTNQYRVGFKMDNLTNEKYWIGYTTVNPQKLRSYALTFAYKF
ncbi:TonB-dependent receptor [Mucilaginibacter sp. HC2]|uniref:TonB-dependent receptor n=1 Tax=Mucilaginibacter inviolabilis TaxID=2714892 RepID=UPI00140CEE6A|nr:TonB-dependent receptor [Mucilaginibacter inviolabilis]NHA06737.1 TonB-dependent receptor [Mucilaginibacter inviolabilis]